MIRRVLITGGTGFIGQALIRLLQSRGLEVVVLSRSAERAKAVLPKACITYVWDSHAGPAPISAFSGVDAVIHLLGENVGGGWWTATRKALIRNSRVMGSQNLCETLAQLSSKPKVLISASAVGIYGDRGDTVLTEKATTGLGFLANVCREWEEAVGKAQDLGIRTVRLRIGLVLGKGGGMLAKMLPAFRWGLGVRWGSGNQWMSWIHVEDLARTILHVLETPDITGIVNAVAPHSLRASEWNDVLSTLLHRPIWIRMPERLVRRMMGDMSELLLFSQRVSSQKLEHSGFRFRYSGLNLALQDIISRRHI